MSGSSVPADAALRALAVALAPFIAPLIGASSRPFSQREPPPGAGRVKYLRTWRRARDAGDAGAWAEGRSRLMTAEAWAKWSRTASPSTATKATPAEPSLLDELGAKRVGS